MMGVVKMNDLPKSGLTQSAKMGEIMAYLYVNKPENCYLVKIIEVVGTTYLHGMNLLKRLESANLVSSKKEKKLRIYSLTNKGIFFVTFLGMATIVFEKKNWNQIIKRVDAQARDGFWFEEQSELVRKEFKKRGLESGTN